MKSGLRALTDVRFRYWVTPALVRWLYLGSMVAFAGMGTFMFLVSWAMAEWMGWPWVILMGVSVVGSVGGVLAVRVGLEAVMVQFVPEHAKPWARPAPSPPRPGGLSSAPPPRPPAVPRPPAPGRPPWP